jgi:hypothetical protein
MTRRFGCVVRREGKEHSLWENPQTGHAEAVPRHLEIANLPQYSRSSWMTHRRFSDQSDEIALGRSVTEGGA